jgi:type IV secretory pathway VirB9-like protein
MRLALTLLATLAAVPALAAEPTEKLGTDERMRKVEHDPDGIVKAYLRVGQSFRFRLDPDERVVKGGLIISDQSTINAGKDDPEEDEEEVDDKKGGKQEGSREQSCDRNSCRFLVLNTVYIMPRVEHEPQPLFLRTEWCPKPGEPCVPGEYAIELFTRKQDAKDAGLNTDHPFYGIKFLYTKREAAWRAAQAAEAAAKKAKEREQFRRDNPPPAMPSVPGPEARTELGKCGSGQAIHPDDAWTDGRNTFLAYNGRRRVPNVYERRADGVETLTSYATEPEPSRTVIRIAKLRTVFHLRDGDIHSCVVNPMADRDTATELAVAPIRNPVAGQPRTGARRTP